MENSLRHNICDIILAYIRQRLRHLGATTATSRVLASIFIILYPKCRCDTVWPVFQFIYLYAHRINPLYFVSIRPCIALETPLLASSVHLLPSRTLLADFDYLVRLIVRSEAFKIGLLSSHRP